MAKLSCVLLVDDDPATNYLNRRILERLDVADTILVALDGEEALAQLAETCTDASNTCPVLIFLDVKMPVMDGFEFLAAFQQLPIQQRQSIVLVMLTTSLHPRDLERLQDLPVADFLNKPLTNEKIEQVLATHFPLINNN